MRLPGTVPSADLKEKIILATVALTVVLWVGFSPIKGFAHNIYKSINKMTTAMPPLLVCIILFIAKVDGERILNFKDGTTKGILWGSIPMTGAATFGKCLSNKDVGLSTWLTNTLSPLMTSMSVKGMIAFFMVWAIPQTDLLPNIVTTTVVSAVALSVLTPCLQRLSA